MSLSKRLKTYKPIRVGRSVFHKIRDVNHHFRVWGEENDPILFYLHGWADTGSTFQFVDNTLGNQTLEVWFDNTRLTNVTTDSEGNFQVFFPVPQDSPLGPQMMDIR